jgi:hypothetical protein
LRNVELIITTGWNVVITSRGSFMLRSCLGSCLAQQSMAHTMGTVFYMWGAQGGTGIFRVVPPWFGASAVCVCVCMCACVSASLF